MRVKERNKITIHGVMISVLGKGLLIKGDSGIGKSECALDLISKGARLISDDSVEIKNTEGKLVASSPEITADLLEIRGLGVINVRDLFGISSVKSKSKIDLCIELIKWNELEDHDRLGLEQKTEEILGVSIPKFILPVSSGKNIPIIVETAVRLFISKTSVGDAGSDLFFKHLSAVSAKK